MDFPDEILEFMIDSSAIEFAGELPDARAAVSAAIGFIVGYGTKFQDSYKSRGMTEASWFKSFMSMNIFDGILELTDDGFRWADGVSEKDIEDIRLYVRHNQRPGIRGDLR